MALSLLAAGGVSQAQQYAISTIAGQGPPPTPIAALNASIGSPSGVAVDGDENVYFASENCVFRVDTNGILTRIAGTAVPGYSGDGRLAVNANLNNPTGIALDAAGNVYIADYGNALIRKVDTTGIISTIAGGGTSPDSDGVAATSAEITPPLGVVVDSTGTVYFSESYANKVRKVSSNGILETAAGTGTLGNSGDGGPATNAQIARPYGLAIDSAGNVYIADPIYGRIRVVTLDGNIHTFPGTDSSTAINGEFAGITGLAVDTSGNLYVAIQPYSVVVKVGTDGSITKVAGGTGPVAGKGGSANTGRLNQPAGVAVDAEGNLFIADSGDYQVRKVSPEEIISTIAGNADQSDTGDGGPASVAQLVHPMGLALDASGNLFIAEGDTNVIREISSAGLISTVAGTGKAGFSGDNGPATQATLNDPLAVALDSAGNLYIADHGNGRIRKVSKTGIITTVAGGGTATCPGSFYCDPSLLGDGGPATAATLLGPSGVAVDSSGNVYIADDGDNSIRKAGTDGIISTVLYGGPVLIPGGVQLLYDPNALTLDMSGNIYVTNYEPVVRISPSGATSMIGSYEFGTAIAIDASGDILLGEAGNACPRVARLTLQGTVTTIADLCPPGYGDGGTAPYPFPPDYYVGGLAVTASGDIYVSDTFANTILLLRPTGHGSYVSAAVNSASEISGTVAPGEIVVLYGNGLGPAQLTEASVQNGRIGTQLSGTTVLFDGVAAPMLYTSANQVAAIAPYEITGASTQVTVSYNGDVSEVTTLSVAASAPALFTLNQTGAGQAAALNAEGTVNTAANPVKVGGYISLYATGEGQTTPAGTDGKVTTTPLPKTPLPVSVTVDGVPATVSYYGAAPGQVAGLMQINVQIPSGVRAGGYVPVALTIGANVSQAGVTIAVAN